MIDDRNSVPELGARAVNILLVEDSRHDRLAFTRAIRGQLPAVITECSDAEEGLAAYRKQPAEWDMVVVDHGLPGMSGLEMCREMAGLGDHPPLVILTGIGSERLAVESLKAGVDDYIIKDAHQGYLELLPVVLGEVLRRHGDRRARQVAEKAIKDASARRKALIDALPVGVISLDEEYNITEINSMAERITGFTANDSLGDMCEEVLRCEACGPFCPMRVSLSRNRPIGPLECSIYNKRGEIIPVSLMANAIEGEDGEFLGGVEIIQDITDWRAMEQERGLLLSMLVHDMKTPLVSIKGFAKLLLDRGSEVEEEKRIQYLDAVYREAGRLESLVGDFLESSRRQQGRLQLNLAETDLKAHLMGLAEELGPRFDSAEVKLVIRLPRTTLPPLKADSARLRRALENLLDNALRHSEPQSAVVLSATINRYEFILKVTDHGEGIPAEDLPHLFQPFFRAGTKRHGSGYGLGLAGVKAIIGAHGGRIGVNSKVGEGTEFEICLPLS